MDFRLNIRWLLMYSQLEIGEDLRLDDLLQQFWIIDSVTTPEENDLDVVEFF